MDGPWDLNVRATWTARFSSSPLAISVAAGLLFGLAPALQASRPGDHVARVKGESWKARAAPACQQCPCGRPDGPLHPCFSSARASSSGASRALPRSIPASTTRKPGNGVAGPGPPGVRRGPDHGCSSTASSKEVRALPEVTAAGMTTRLPLGLRLVDRGVDIPGYEFAEGERRSLN